jgi:DhnA family fructose-bisphosphate aldolase class Ia
MVAAAGMLIDLLIVGGTSAVCAVAAGGIGLVLSRKFWQRHKVASCVRQVQQIGHG